MNTIVVAYFSASGVTARVARELARITGGELHEIIPSQAYTSADLNWHDSHSRSSLEMKDPSSRPAISGSVKNMDACTTLFLGFPIWWYVAPTIINTFLEHYDLTGKTIIPFATSGSSGMGDTNSRLKPSCPGAILKEGKRFPAEIAASELEKWVESVR